MKKIMPAILPLSVSLALTGVAVSGSALAAQDSGVISFSLGQITDSLTCPAADGQGDNCITRVRPKLSCNTPGDVPAEVRVTYGAAQMRTEVGGENPSPASACFAMLQGAHLNLTTQILGLAPDIINGTGGDSNDPVNVRATPAPPGPGCNAAYNNTSIWQFFLAANDGNPGTGPDLVVPPEPFFLETNKAGKVFTYTPSDPEFNVLVGNSGNFTAQFFGNASVDTYQSGTSLDVVETEATGSVRVELTCRTPRLTCTKNLSGSVNGGTGDLTATVNVTGSSLTPLAQLIIDDQMDSPLSYRGGTSTAPIPGEPNVPSPPDGSSSITWNDEAVDASGNINLTFSYGIRAAGLPKETQACNDVTVRVGADNRSAQCEDCVIWVEEEDVPAIGAVGTGALALGLSGLGLLFGFRRRG